jgi:transcription elongation factor Elf1
MKYFLLLCMAFATCNICNAQTKVSQTNVVDATMPIKIVEVSCGQCQFKMAGKGCNLAVRIKGKSYFVDGTSIDEHGDAHADDGFCKAIRKAEVQGKVVKNRFVATYFKLL